MKDPQGGKAPSRSLLAGDDPAPVVILLFSLAMSTAGWWLARLHGEPLLLLCGGWAGSVLLMEAARRYSSRSRRGLRADGESVPLTLGERAAEARRLVIAASRSDSAVVIIDANRRIEWVNEVFSRITERSIAEIAGRSPGDIVFGRTAGAEGAEAEDFWCQVEGGEIRSLEVSGKTGSGQRYSLDYELQTIRSPSGRLVNIIAIGKDITDRKAAEEALRDSEQRVRAIIETTPECVKLVASDGRLLEMNPAGLEMIGASAWDEVAGSSVYDLIAPEHRDRYRAFNERVCQGHSGSLLFEIIGLKGTRRWMESRAVPLRQTPEGLIVQLGMTRDVTKRKHAEDALRESESRLQGILDHTPAVISLKDTEGRYILVNRGFLGMIASDSPEAVQGRTDDALFSVEMAQAFRENDEKVLECGRPLEFEEMAPGPTGPRTYLSVKFPLRDPQGSVYGLGAISTDISEHKRVEWEIDRAREAALQAALDGARLKSEFLANMSHEVRTPMNGILGMTELVLETDLTTEQRDYVETIRSSSDALLNIINDILDFSKVEAGRLDLEAIPFSPRNAVRDTLKSLAMQAHKKGLELACHIDPEVPDAVVGDPGRLRQILTNLVSNAVKFTERGEVAVRIDIETRDADTLVLHFLVRDTGIGIPAEKHALVFEPFAQADGSTTRKYGGTGLGLAIVSQLVEAMHGRLWLESEPGLGSEFHFTVCMSLDKDPKVAPILAERTELQGLRVLVVDDNATNRKILVEILRAWRMRPVPVEGGMAALAALRRAVEQEDLFTIALLDVQMPEMDGFTLAQRIQEDPRVASVHLLLLTSSGLRGDAARCRELGVAGYLTKPVMPPDLLETMQAILGSRTVDAGADLVTRHSLRDARARLRILLAEDNAVNRTVAQRLLEKRGHSVLAVEDGREALDALERESFDVALVDVQMPDIDGFEATAAIRAKEQRTGRHLPIIALTAHALKGDRERCLAAGMDGYVSKPIEADLLFETIERVLGGRLEVPIPPSIARMGSTLDRESLLSRVDGDTELLEEIVAMFCEDGRRLLAEIRISIAEGDSGRLERASHRLKGALGTLAARPAEESAGRLEAIGREGDLSGAEAALATLENEIERLEPQLAALTKGAVVV